MLFKRNGCPAGHDIYHWPQAETDYLEALRCSQTGVCWLVLTLRPHLEPDPVVLVRAVASPGLSGRSWDGS